MDPHIHITYHKKGLKMSGFISINTSQNLNRFCQSQRNNERAVCKYCYGRGMEINYSRLRAKLIKNFYRLSVPLSDEEILNLSGQIREENKLFIRFHSIGELTGINHLLNFYSLCESLPDNRFGLWTKRPGIVQKTKRVPDNLSMIYSNPVIDQPLNRIPARFNGIFNVVSYEWCIENSTIPNCSGACMKCLKCYTGDPVVVTELLKKDQTSITKGFIPPLEEVIK